jgi:alkanesulfonate monooxygenase SsuD/methylene tetrahydromethanopterin reductase-like flavin-dependent oxidoreductase (luciferase family)
VPVGRRGRGFVEHLAAMRACWAPDPVEFHGEHYEIARSAVGPKPHGDTIPVLFGALVRPTIERAVALADGVILVAVDWGETRTRAGWYRDAGGTGTVVVNTLPSWDGDPGDTAFTAAVLADVERATAAGADEMHVTLNLGTPIPPDRQAERLAALAAELGLDRG